MRRLVQYLIWNGGWRNAFLSQSLKHSVWSKFRLQESVSFHWKIDSLIFHKYSIWNLVRSLVHVLQGWWFIEDMSEETIKKFNWLFRTLRVESLWLSNIYLILTKPSLHSITMKIKLNSFSYNKTISIKHINRRRQRFVFFSKFSLSFVH